MKSSVRSTSLIILLVGDDGITLKLFLNIIRVQLDKGPRHVIISTKQDFLASLY